MVECISFYDIHSGFQIFFLNFGFYKGFRKNIGFSNFWGSKTQFRHFEKAILWSVSFYIYIGLFVRFAFKLLCRYLQRF